MRGADATSSDRPARESDPRSAPGNARAPLLPRLTPRRDHVLPILIALSLAVHATVILPSLLRDRDPPVPPAVQETPVEVVQEPPKPPEKPAQAVKPPAPQPKAEQGAKPQQAAKPQQEARAKQDTKAKAQQAKATASHRQSPRQQTARAQPRPPETPEQKQDEDQQRQERLERQQAAVAERMKRLLGPIPAGMDATALPGSSADGSIDVTYTQLVLSQVAKAKKEGKFHGRPGAASVAFVVGDGGELVSAEVVRPSGDASLDEEAVAMIHRAAPFPPPPPGGRRDYTVTLMFKPIS